MSLSSRVAFFLVVSLTGLFGCSSDDDSSGPSGSSGSSGSGSGGQGGSAGGAGGSAGSGSNADLFCAAIESAQQCAEKPEPCKADEKCFANLMSPEAAKAYTDCFAFPSCKGDGPCLLETVNKFAEPSDKKLEDDCLAKVTKCPSVKDDNCSSIFFVFGTRPKMAACVEKTSCEEFEACVNDALEPLSICKPL